MVHDLGNILFVPLLLLVCLSCWVVSSSFCGRFVDVHEVMELASVDTLYAGPYSFAIRGVSLFATSSSDAVAVGQD